MYCTHIVLSTGCDMVLEVFLCSGSRPRAVCGFDVLSAETRFVGAKGIGCSTAFDPCGPEPPGGNAGRRSLMPTQQTIASTATTPTAISHRPLYHRTCFRFEAAPAECVSASNFPARAMKVLQAWKIARLLTASSP